MKVLDAFADGEQTVVWCSWCVHWHRHAMGAEGHRWAHCFVEGSPYDEGGYVLRLRGKWTKDIQRMYAHEERNAARTRRQRRRDAKAA